FDVFTPQGTYFVNVDTAPLGFADSLELARWLPEQIGVAAIPVPVFCHPDGARRTRSLLRFAFCKKTEVLQDAAQRLASLRKGA
ncbi:MAG: aminotransferase, partial [Arthrobacter sp.]